MRSLPPAFVLLALAASRLAAGEPVDLLLVAADEATLRPVLARLPQATEETHAAWTLWSGQLAGKRVVLTRAEGDPLNAVAATTLALRLHPPRLVLVFGPGRVHDANLKQGDVVVSERFAAFDGMVSPITALDGGSQPLRWQKLPHLLMTDGERETSAETFPADAAAAALALRIAPAHGRVVAGMLGSANQVNREADRIAWLHVQWRTSTEDGVSAHVAGCAALLGIPVVGFCVAAGMPGDAADFTLRFVAMWK